MLAIGGSHQRLHISAQILGKGFLPRRHRRGGIAKGPGEQALGSGFKIHSHMMRKAKLIQARPGQRGRFARRQ